VNFEPGYLFEKMKPNACYVRPYMVLTDSDNEDPGIGPEIAENRDDDPGTMSWKECIHTDWIEQYATPNYHHLRSPKVLAGARFPGANIEL
jgi:hypothetical protein